METSKLVIPKLCKAGFQTGRAQTYSGKLAYIIYFDGKTWRKEPSWNSWRHHEGAERNFWNEITRKRENGICDESVRVLEFTNVPTEGFVLNKKAGGYSTGWNHRSTYARVFDSARGIEFEISIPNLLYILQETDCVKGKGLVGEFVYAWDGKDLVLLPCCSPDYKASQAFTELQSGKISAKDLIVGATYKTKKDENVVYLGKKEWGNFGKDYILDWFRSTHVFYELKSKSFTPKSSVDFLAGCVDDQCCSDFAELIDKFQESYDRVKEVRFEKVEKGDLKINKGYYRNEFQYKTLYYPPIFFADNREVKIIYYAYSGNHEPIHTISEHKRNLETLSRSKAPEDERKYWSFDKLLEDQELKVCYIITEKGKKILLTK